MYSLIRIVCSPVAALHQGTPGQMTWLEDPPPGSALSIAVLRLKHEQKIKMLAYLTSWIIICFLLTVKQLSAALVACFEGDDYRKEEKCRHLFKGKSATWGLRIF